MNSASDLAKLKSVSPDYVRRRLWEECQVDPAVLQADRVAIYKGVNDTKLSRGEAHQHFLKSIEEYNALPEDRPRPWASHTEGKGVQVYQDSLFWDAVRYGSRIPQSTSQVAARYNCINRLA